MWVAATNMEYVGSLCLPHWRCRRQPRERFEISTDIIPSLSSRPSPSAIENNGLIAERRGNVVASTDGGATWTVTNKPATLPHPAGATASLPSPTAISSWASDDLGVYF
jgi:hypothetical protein